MIMMLKNIFIALFAFACFVPCFTQDAHFSQYYQVPAYLNPSLVGNFNGLYKVGINYRDQWRAALDRPYATFTATGESKFEIGQERNPDIAALGIIFFSDKLSQYNLNTTQLALTGSYHKLLDRKNKSYLGIGYQIGIIQKALNYENLTFGDQFNALDAYSNETLEVLPGNNIGFFDMSIGVDYATNPTSGRNFSLGFGIFHFTSPNISFFNTPENIDKDLNTDAVLDPRFVVHTSYNIPTGPNTSVEPRALFMSQDKHKLFLLSSLFKYKNPKTEGRILYFGPSLRFSNNLTKLAFESIIFTVGIDYNGMNFGLSYDYNLPDLINSRNGLGTFEFSFNYYGEYENSDAFCPTF